MAQIKISELELNTQMSNEDVLAGVDTSEQKTKKFKLETLKTFINKEQDEQITKNKNDISANATNIKTNAENISKNSENIEKNAQDIAENKDNIADNTNRTKRIENTLYDSGEANGTSINIKDSTLAEFQEISVDGVCKQETTQGYNFLNLKVEQNSSSISIVPNEDGTVTLNGTSPGTQIKFENIVLIANKTYKAKAILVSGSITNSKNSFGFRSPLGDNGLMAENNFVTHTPTEDATRFTMWIDEGSVFNNATFKIYAYEGTDDKPYEPYTGGQPSPSPSYPQPIEVIDEDFEVISCGKQLLKLENQTRTSNDVTIIVENETINASGVANSNWANLTTGEKTKANLQKGKVYTMVLNQPAPYNFYAKNGDQYVIIYRNQKTTTFTQKDEYKSIYFFIAELTSGTEISINDLKVMIYEGEYDTTRNDFEPYQETRVPINLPDGEFVGKLSDTIKDQVRLAFNEEKGEYHAILEKKIGKVVFDGSHWCRYVTSSNNIQVVMKSGTKLGIRGFGLCDYYRYGDSGKLNEFDVAYPDSGVGSSSFYFHTPSEDINTAELFKEWLDENKPTVYYLLAEPYEIDLGVVDMPLSYSSETNVFTTSELEAIINAKYYRNFVNTIQNLQVNEKALKQELVDIQNQLKALQVNVSNLSVLATNDEVESEVVE